jgi:hypothetical protein
VLVDHLVAGSKESRIVASVAHPQVLVTGHPYVDIWQAVKPAAVGIPRWPEVPRGRPWKEGVCDALRVVDPAEMWRRVQRGVRSYADLEVPLLRAVEELIDFVTAPESEPGPQTGARTGARTGAQQGARTGAGAGPAPGRDG